MKALDNRNATSRRKALEQDNVRPYPQLYVDYRDACPYCDQVLTQSDHVYSRECACSYWQATFSNPFKYLRTEKVKHDMP